MQILRFIHKNKLFFLIFFISFVLRIYNIADFPPSLNWDEVSHGYNAYSILKTGKDEWGDSWPIIFRAYGDYKLPVYIYATALSELFFGLSSFAVRFPSLVAGIFIVIFTYLLTKRLFNKNTALIATLLVCLEPWSLFLSRGAFEANLSLSFIVAGIYFFLRALEKLKFLPLSLFLLGLSVWTYNSARVFVPLMLISMILIYRKDLVEKISTNKKDLDTSKKILTSSLMIVFLFFVPMSYQLLSPVGQARYQGVVILDEGAIAQINEKRKVSEFSLLISQLIYNKGTYFTKRFITNYISHFSPRFLFLEGGSHYQFSVPSHGILYIVNLPFFYLGIAVLIFQVLKSTERQTTWTKRRWLIVLAWVLLAPIPSSLTRESPHVLRSIVFLPLPMILSTYGLIFFLEKLNRNIRLIGVALYLILLLLFVENYLEIYFNSYRKDYSWSWQYGYKEAVEYVKDHYGDYDKIVVTKKYGEPHEFFLFFGAAAGDAPWTWDPGRYRSNPNLIRFYQSNWYWVDRFDKFYFVNDWEIPKNNSNFVLESKRETVDCKVFDCLLITSPRSYPIGWNKLKTINFLDGKPSFEILDNKI